MLRFFFVHAFVCVVLSVQDSTKCLRHWFAFQHRCWPTNQNHCHQWLSDSRKMHKLCFWPGLCPEPLWGSLRCSPRPSSRLKGWGRGGKKGTGSGRVMKQGDWKREREGRGGQGEGDSVLLGDWRAW